jgi:phosphoadenosine phosphosulfate reductase
MKNKIKRFNKQFEYSTTQEILEYLLNNTQNRVAFSSSFGAEDQALTHMILNVNENSNIFTLDTGRLPHETYTVMDETNKKYNTKINVFFPNNRNVEELYQDQGINGFYNSLENRKNCCFVRKIEPLSRALKNVDFWITGIRASQSLTREKMELFEYDETNNVVKVNPLIHYSEEEIWGVIKTNDVPYNKLHDRGYPSIGCAPCTRAVKENEDIRSGRWWWENKEHKECGLHQR